MLTAILAAEVVTPMPLDLGFFVGCLKTLHKTYPFLGTLLAMMTLDVLCGICAAWITNSVSSTVSHAGMVKKVVILLLVAVGIVLEPYSAGMPLSSMIATFFIISEGISITENAARSGVPVPDALAVRLQKLHNKEKASVRNGAAVNISQANKIDIHTEHHDQPFPVKNHDSVVIVPATADPSVE